MDSIQQAAQEQFQRRSHRYGKGHILEDTRDVTTALEGLSIPPGAEALDIATASPSIRDHYRMAIEDGKTVWWWPMLTLIAQKPG